MWILNSLKLLYIFNVYCNVSFIMVFAVYIIIIQICANNQHFSVWVAVCYRLMLVSW